MKMTLLLCLLWLSACSDNATPEIYLIPKGFTGRVTVIFNQKNGVPAKFENGSRVYEIPSNGILLTKFRDEYGWVNHHYYYVDSLGNRELLEIYENGHNSDGSVRGQVVDSNKVGVFSDGTVGQYSEEDKAPFQFFYVSSYNGFDTMETFDHFNKRINKLIGTNL